MLLLALGQDDLLPALGQDGLPLALGQEDLVLAAGDVHLAARDITMEAAGDITAEGILISFSQAQ